MSQDTSFFYQTGRKIAQAKSIDSIYQAVRDALKQDSLICAIVSVDDSGKLRIHSLPELPSAWVPPAFDNLPALADIEPLFLPDKDFLIVDMYHAQGLPPVLVDILKPWGCNTTAFVPIFSSGHLQALLAIGSQQDNLVTAAAVQSYSSLSHLVAANLEKLKAQVVTEKRLSELEILNTTSQIMASGITLSDLYGFLHKQVSRLMGDIPFLIALYDTKSQMIELPYVYDSHEVKALDPFPMGQGLVSQVLRSRQPLMLVKDTAEQAVALGAVTIGEMAKSWLGVPLMVAGEAIGVMVVQDVEKENAFDLDDQNLLNTIAGQVASTIHNVRLLENARQIAERERRIHEVTSKIRASVDMRSILATATTEIGKVLKARRTRIEIGIEQPAETPGNNENGSTEPLDQAGARVVPD